MRVAVLAIATAFLAMPGRADPAPRELTRDDLESWLEGFLPYAIAREDIAGAAVVVVRNGAILAERGYGFADVAKRIRVDPARTLFRTGSVGKLFTWTAVMQQVEAGKLDLDRDVNDYLDFRIPARDGQPITLRNLMTHTPGFEEPIKRLVTDRPESLPTPEAYLKAWTPARIFAPGEVPAYSNYGVTLAGYILERVTGEKYDDYIDRNLFSPLGMARSTTRQPLPARLHADMSQGYQLGSGPTQPFELFGVAPAGGASTTVADMGRFMTAWLQGGRFGTTQVLRAETVRQVFDTRLPILPPLNSMLLGFYEKNLNGRRIAGHGGDSQFFHSSLNLFVDEGIGVYVVVNSTGRAGGAGTLLSRFMGEFADRYFPASAVESSVGAKAAAEHARQVSGTYISSRRQESNLFSVLGFLGQIKVTLDKEGGLLVPALTDTDGEPMKWREVRALRLGAGRRQGATRGPHSQRACRASRSRLRLAVSRPAARAVVEVVRDLPYRSSPQRSRSFSSRSSRGRRRPASPALPLVAAACRSRRSALSLGTRCRRGCRRIAGGLDGFFLAAVGQPLRVLARARSLGSPAQGRHAHRVCRRDGCRAVGPAAARRPAASGRRDPRASCSCSRSARCCGSPLS